MIRIYVPQHIPTSDFLSEVVKILGTYSSFLGADLDGLDVVGRLAGILELLMNDVSGFGSGLSV